VVLRKNRSNELGVFAQFLFGENLLSRDGALIVLEQDAIATYGIYYVQQNKLAVDPERCQPLFEKWRDFAQQTKSAQ
jgi:hypothetical protein